MYVLATKGVICPCARHGKLSIAGLEVALEDAEVILGFWAFPVDMHVPIPDHSE